MIGDIARAETVELNRSAVVGFAVFRREERDAGCAKSVVLRPNVAWRRIIDCDFTPSADCRRWIVDFGGDVFANGDRHSSSRFNRLAAHA